MFGSFPGSPNVSSLQISYLARQFAGIIRLAENIDIIMITGNNDRINSLMITPIILADSLIN
jgi:hypothetical protein